MTKTTPSTPLAATEATATEPRQMASWVHVSTPQGPSGLSCAELLSEALPAHSVPPLISGCPTPSSFVSIVDSDDHNWSVAVDIDCGPPLQLCVPPSSAVSVKAAPAVPVELELGSVSVSSTTSSGGAPSKLLHTVPRPSSTIPTAPLPRCPSARPGL